MVMRAELIGNGLCNRGRSRNVVLHQIDKKGSMLREMDSDYKKFAKVYFFRHYFKRV